jgi:methyltransferase (TIGR00027 family)
MRDGEPSRTAFAVAWRRALHQTVDDARIFADPLAWRILGAEPPTDEHELAVAAEDERPLRLFIATRHRVAEDAVAAAYARGTRQVVVLGAGLDTFAYRNPHEGLRVFEVDFPATQTWKRERLAEADIPEGDVRYVGVDFLRDDLRQRLVAAGFDPARSSVVMWLGVVFYLTPDAVAGTLRTLAGFSRCTVVFDYPVPEDSPERRAFLERVAALGEPFLSAFTPEEMAGLLREAGFTHIDDRTFGHTGRAHVMIAASGGAGVAQQQGRA